MPRRQSRKPRRSNKSGLNRTEKKQVLNLIKKREELKYIDSNETDSSLISTSGFAMDGIPTIVQGDDNAERIGDSINLKSLRFQVLLKSGTASGLVQAFVFQELTDTAPSGISINHSSVPINSPFPKMDVAHQAYKILFNRRFVLDDSNMDTKYLDIKLPASKLGIKKITFESPTGNIVTSGKVSLYIKTDNTTASQMTVDCNCRVEYYD